MNKSINCLDTEEMITNVRDVAKWEQKECYKGYDEGNFKKTPEGQRRT